MRYCCNAKFSGLPINILSQLVAADKNGINGPLWAPIPGVASMRIDGLPKVLGHKIYARDFHASDMDDWPATERFLYALRVDKVDQIFKSYNLSILPLELQPINIVDHAKITNDNMSLAGGMTKPFFVEQGKLSDHYGLPVAIFIFENFNIYRKAKSILQYSIPGQQDMPKKQKLIILDPPSDEKAARGIAEAVMSPIPPAILNALSMATAGHRFNKLPVTIDDIKGVLL